MMSTRRKPRVDINAINGAALAVLPSLVRRWLPDGHLEGDEYVALNPRRDDRHLGSFKINLTTGCWADFALDDAGGRDPISLVAYLHRVTRVEAARRLAILVGVRDDR